MRAKAAAAAAAAAANAGCAAAAAAAAAAWWEGTRLAVLAASPCPPTPLGKLGLPPLAGLDMRPPPYPPVIDATC